MLNGTLQNFPGCKRIKNHFCAPGRELKLRDVFKICSSRGTIVYSTGDPLWTMMTTVQATTYREVKIIGKEFDDKVKKLLSA